MEEQLRNLALFTRFTEAQLKRSWHSDYRAGKILIGGNHNRRFSRVHHMERAQRNLVIWYSTRSTNYEFHSTSNGFPRGDEESQIMQLIHLIAPSLSASGASLCLIIRRSGRMILLWRKIRRWKLENEVDDLMEEMWSERANDDECRSNPTTLSTDSALLVVRRKQEKASIPVLMNIFAIRISIHFSLEFPPRSDTSLP